MNFGLLKKNYRDSAALLLLTLVAIALFEVLFVAVMSNLAPDLQRLWSGIRILRRIFNVAFSIDLAGEVAPGTLVVLGFVHPFLFAVTWGFLITHCTRVTVGEIDRGTADVLLSLPVARSTVYTTATIVWLAASLIMVLTAWFAVWLGERFFPLSESLDFRGLAIVGVNLLALYVAIGGGTMLISALSNRRGVAVAVVLSLLLLSFLINFIEPFLPWVERIRFLGVLHYYRPVEAVRDGALPWRNIAILAGGGTLSWLAGLVAFTQRDVTAP